MDWKKQFTIVTPALNCREYLLRNLNSVRAQGLPEAAVEHWVIDGGSRDGTVELLKGQSGVSWVSETDRGLSHATNKGIERASGEWIIWLNADDELAPGALQAFLAAKAAHPKIRLFCGAQQIFGYDGQLEKVNPGWDYNLKDLLGARTGINQASTFVHREVYQAVGGMDETFRYAMDYEWAVRASRRFRCQPLESVLSHYYRRPGSIMDAGIARQHREFLRVRRMHSRSYLEWAEWRIRFYLLTEPVRKISWFRRQVRALKGLCGRKPLHPVPGEQ